MGCRAEIRTRACLTASQRATNWATLHPTEPHCTLHPDYFYTDLEHRSGLVLKRNSWTYNFVEVSGHNLESSQVSLYNIYFKPLLLGGGGGVIQSVSRIDVNSKEDNSYKILSQLCPRIRPLVTEFPWRRLCIYILVLHWYTRQSNGSQGVSPSQFNGKYCWGSTMQYICFDDNMLRSFFVCSFTESVYRYLFLSGFLSCTVFWRIFLFRCWQVKCTWGTGALIFYSMYFYTWFSWYHRYPVTWLVELSGLKMTKSL
jgi:hypothetical protein